MFDKNSTFEQAMACELNLVLHVRNHRSKQRDREKVEHFVGESD